MEESSLDNHARHHGYLNVSKIRDEIISLKVQGYNSLEVSNMLGIELALVNRLWVSRQLWEIRQEEER